MGFNCLKKVKMKEAETILFQVLSVYYANNLFFLLLLNNVIETC